jgi:hypothetical protein
MKTVQVAFCDLPSGGGLSMRGAVIIRWSASMLLAAAMLAAVSASAKAQSFAFSIGSGGHGHGHGHHHHHHHHRGGWSFAYGAGPYWGPGWYAPPPVVYTAPVVQPVVQPIYIQPQAASAPPAAVPAYTASSSAPAPAANSLAANSSPSLAGSTPNDDRIVIRNVAGAQLPVSFLVDGQDVELNDGATRTFVGKSHRTVQYDRGGRFGSTQQDLSGGQYEFRITATGWDLVRRPDITPSTRTAVRSNSLPEGNVR